MLSKLLLAFPLLAFLLLPALAMDSIESDHGNWPKTWPNELEPLRKQAVSGRGGLAMNPFHEIRLSKTDREKFETAWPQILSLKSDGATLTLMDGNHYYQNVDDVVAGLRICPPMEGAKTGPLSKTRITLMVDGNVIDLNRIRLPLNIPIEDTRFRNAR